MNDAAIEKYFLKTIEDDKNMSNGIAAIKTLLWVLEHLRCEFHHFYNFFVILMPPSLFFINRFCLF